MGARADGQLPGGQHQRDIRPLPPTRPASRRRDDRACRPLPARAARVDDRRRARGDLTSAGDRAVRGVPERARGERARRVQHGGRSQGDRRREARRRRGDRVTSRRRAVRPGLPRRPHPDVPRQPHALRRALARPHPARRAGQVVARLRRRPRRRLALPLPRRVRRAAPEPDEARVAPATGPSLGIRLLRGRRRARGRADDGRRARGSERARDVHASPRHVRES